jgi:hypothetical protein
VDQPNTVSRISRNSVKDQVTSERPGSPETRHSVVGPRRTPNLRIKSLVRTRRFRALRGLWAERLRLSDTHHFPLIPVRSRRRGGDARSHLVVISSSHGAACDRGGSSRTGPSAHRFMKDHRLLQLRRPVIGEVERFPPSSACALRAGPRRTADRKSSGFRRLADRGLLRIDDA